MDIFTMVDAAIITAFFTGLAAIISAWFNRKDVKALDDLIEELKVELRAAEEENDSLHEQVGALSAQVKIWEEKYSALCTRVDALEQQNTELKARAKGR